MANNPFGGTNPFGGGGAPKKEAASASTKKGAATTAYETTGESSRDHVRKTFYDIFNAEPDSDASLLLNGDIAGQLET